MSEKTMLSGLIKWAQEYQIQRLKDGNLESLSEILEDAEKWRKAVSYGKIQKAPGMDGSVSQEPTYVELVEKLEAIKKENTHLKGIIERNYHLSEFNDTGMDGCDVEWVSALDKLEAIKPYIEHDFFDFYKAMIDIYNEHKSKGDSWKTVSWGYLMDRCAVQFEDMENRDDEDFYANIGNYTAMLWVRKNILGVEPEIRGLRDE